MRILNIVLIVLLGMSLSACSNTSESYQISIKDFSTEVYDELHHQNDESYFTMSISNSFVDEIGIYKVSISIPEDYNILDDTDVSINFEVNGYLLCSEDFKLHYYNLSGFTLTHKSCVLSLMDLDVSEDDFLNDTIDIYIILNYTNTEEQAVVDKHLYALIYGSLVKYRK